MSSKAKCALLARFRATFGYNFEAVMKEIQLTQGKVSFVDNEEFEKLNKYKWHILKNKRGYLYAVRHNSENHDKLILMHRQIKKKLLYHIIERH